MTTIDNSLPVFLQVVTWVNRSVAHGDHRSTHSRHGGSLGTGNTLLVTRSAQRGLGKHRVDVAARKRIIKAALRAQEIALTGRAA